MRMPSGFPGHPRGVEWGRSLCQVEHSAWSAGRVSVLAGGPYTWGCGDLLRGHLLILSESSCLCQRPQMRPLVTGPSAPPSAASAGRVSEGAVAVAAEKGLSPEGRGQAGS